MKKKFLTGFCLMAAAFLAGAESVTRGTENYRGFSVDNVLHSQSEDFVFEAQNYCADIFSVGKFYRKSRCKRGE